MPGQSLCSNCHIKSKKNSGEPNDRQNDATYSTELEKATNASFSEAGILPIKNR
jgi:hypothetical protein